MAATTRERFLKDAIAVVNQRDEEYGSPADDFKRVAERWNVTLAKKLKKGLTPEEVVLCLIDLKLARWGHGSNKWDTLVDVAGYSGCLAECLVWRRRRDEF